MKNQKKYRSLALALALCVSLTACGGGENADDPNNEAGSDWRTTGIVRDSGSITRDGLDIDVLVCVYDDDAAFYYDNSHRILYDSVEYPITLYGDPWESFQSIDFADRNGDDNSDVAMLFDIKGETMLMVWFWDSSAGAFVFQDDESYLPDGAGVDTRESTLASDSQDEDPQALIQTYVGYWQGSTGDWLRFYVDMDWDTVGADGEEINAGVVTPEKDALYLYVRDVGLVSKLLVQPDGTLLEEDSGLVYLPIAEDDTPEFIRTELG